MINKSKRKILKISAYTLGSLIVLLVGFHFWFINHAEKILEDLVESRSNGKLKLHIKKFKFNWFSNNMQLRNAVFYSTDTNAATAYRFSSEKINIRVKEILPLIFEKKILIDSLGLINPEVEVTRLRFSKDVDTAKNKKVSLAREMGKVYNSIQDALQVLEVNRFQIDNGKFTLINKIKPDALPVSITHIYFHLDNLQVDTSNATGRQKILFSDNVSLHTFNQDILFPDGRHRLSFSNFHINIPKKFVEFDSCTISATKSDSSKTSFSVFFDKLQMTNIDFDTLYQKEVIKADSVYCINPEFKLDAELGTRTGKKKLTPRLDELIQLLTGDMELAFVVVNNGSFDINTVRDGKPNSFTSDHNNFEVQGLQIKRDRPKPFSVESFAMAIRNYENFLKDSAYAMQFDSILFLNNSVYLSNFSFRQVEDAKVINSFTMPQFELKGLSWDDLVFDRRLVADRATLYRPVINYSVPEKKKHTIFQTLADIGKRIQLNNLDISDGYINIHFRGNAQLQLENASISILSQDLVQSKRVVNLQRAIRALQFKKGFFKMPGLEAKIENGNFDGHNGQITATAIYIADKEKNFIVNAKNVAIKKMVMDNNSNITEINGVQWKEANLQITGSLFKNNISSPGFTIRNIQGGNTILTSTGNQKLSAFLESVSADEFISKVKDKPKVVNLRSNGKNFSFTDSSMQLTIDHFLFADHQHSVMENVSFKKNTATDSVSVTIPMISLEPDLNSIINGSIAADNVKLQQPVINIRQIHRFDTKPNEVKKLPGVVIGKLTIQQPEFSLIESGDRDTRVEWAGKSEKNNFFELTNFKIINKPATVISADQIEFGVNNFSVTAGHRTFTTGKGSITTKITGFHLDSMESSQWNWKGLIAEMQIRDILWDNLGKHAGLLEIKSARLSDLTVRSASFLNFRQAVKENTAFRLKEVTGQYNNTKNHFDWQNLNYDKNSKILSVDSFTYRPTAEKDSFVANLKYQADYTTLSTGAVSVGPLDIDKYVTDTVINAGTVNITSAYMKVFRDKRKPAREGVIKPLPVNLLKRIPARLSVDTANLDKITVQYAELNEKTNQTGTVIVSSIKGKAFPVVNYDMRQGDTLHLEAQGLLMDSVAITLKLRESYTDSLAGFLLSATAAHADARIVNPILIPLVSAKLESGFLDTLSMHVGGNEYIAIGEMQMYYHDLRVKILNNGVEKKKAFFNGFVNFLANNFIIKKNNHSRTGDIFFERIRNKSTMNYLVKIVFSGIGSNVGLKKSKKLLRHYKKEMRKRNHDPIKYD